MWTKSCKTCGGHEPSVDKTNLQEVPVLAARLRADGDFSVLSVLTFKTNLGCLFRPSFSADTKVIDEPAVE